MITFTITNKHRPKATVVMLINFYGQQYRKSIGVGLPAKYWNEKKNCARTTADFNGNPINEQIERWEKLGKKAIKHFTDQKVAPTQKEFAKLLSELSAAPACEEPQKELYFCDYYEHTYIPRYQRVRKADTVKKYYTALHKFRQYEAVEKRKIQFADINIDFYNNFKAWFYEQGFSTNYFGNIIKILKQAYKEARVYDQLHTYNGTEHRDFVAPKQTADSVYLTTQELDKIYRLQLTPSSIQDTENPLTPENAEKKIKALQRARGLFLIGCYTGLRVSDFSRLKQAHIGKYITIKTKKMGANVIIPIHPVVKKIIQSGFDLEDTVSDQKLNKQIKELCQLAGITEKVLLNINVGGRNEEVYIEKYKVIASHTARRSFATNAYKAGVPILAIMKITGHTKVSTFLEYIKVSKQENAEILSKHSFFMDAKKQGDFESRPAK